MNQIADLYRRHSDALVRGNVALAGEIKLWADYANLARVNRVCQVTIVTAPDAPVGEIHFRDQRTGGLMGKLTNIGS